jgi:hypothetical protein
LLSLRARPGAPISISAPTPAPTHFLKPTSSRPNVSSAHRAGREETTVTVSQPRSRTGRRTRPSTAAGRDIIDCVTTRELAHKMLDDLPEERLEDAVRAISALEQTRTVDDWGDLSKLHEVAFGETMRRLAAQALAAGREPW